jgi:predicted PhzF superfamily epimerase YddE/YHI9
MTEVHVLRVFTDEQGRHGNPLGVLLDTAGLEDAGRQAIATKLNFSETVFVDDVEEARLRIFTPAAEIALAGHPLVGTAWLLRQEGDDVASLRPPAGEVPVRFDGDTTYITGRPEWAPEFEIVELGTPEEVEALDGPPGGGGLVGVWAWEDEGSGRVRVRVFAPGLGVDEDEATGAHAVRLADTLGREVRIRQGEGSIILARPLADGGVEIGGRTVAVEVRDY